MFDKIRGAKTARPAYTVTERECFYEAGLMDKEGKGVRKNEDNEKQLLIRARKQGNLGLWNFN